jgi:hypothetical protein
MTNSIIVVKGRLTYLVSPTKYSSSAFFNSRKIGCLSFLFLETLSSLLSLQKGIKGQPADGMADKNATQTLKEFQNVEKHIAGVAEE